MARPEATGRGLTARTPRRTVNLGRGDPEDDALVLSIPQAGRLLGLSRNSAYEASWRGDFPVVKIGGRRFVPKAAVTAMLDAVTTEWQRRRASAA